MSDDLLNRAAALVEKEKAWDEWEYPSQPAPPAMVQGEVATLVSDMAAEITRLRAWRDAINGYLTEAWNSPLRDDESPLAALKRLIKLELTAMALDPEIHKSMNAAIATARRDGMEEANTLVDLYAKAALKCKQCGDICHDYCPDNCTGRTQYRESEEYKRRLIYDGEYSAMRYFEKHLCRPEMMDAEDAFKALANAIRAAAGEVKP